MADDLKSWLNVFRISLRGCNCYLQLSPTIIYRMAAPDFGYLFVCLRYSRTRFAIFRDMGQNWSTPIKSNLVDLRRSNFGYPPYLLCLTPHFQGFFTHPLSEFSMFDRKTALSSYSIPSLFSKSKLVTKYIQR